MKEITRAKRLEVVHYYLLGYSYKEIEEKTGVSHGSIANIVGELENGNLTIPGTPFDQINDLRQLSIDLKKSGRLNSSQALHGFTFFKRLRDLQVSPEQLDVWSEFTGKVLSPDFPAREFLEAAKRLRELEKTQGLSFEILAEEYERNRENSPFPHKLRRLG